VTYREEPVFNRRTQLQGRAGITVLGLLLLIVAVVVVVLLITRYVAV
jgi:hypothetical protein